MGCCRASRQFCTAFNPRGDRSASPDSSPETNRAVTAAATMRLSRQGGGSGDSHSGRAWQVVIDGRVVGTIRNNETLDLPVEAGHHAVQVMSRRFLRSPKESLEVTEGQVVGLSCRRRARHPFIVQRSIFLLAGSIFKHDVWISLTPDDTGETGLEGDGNDDALRREAVAASRSPVGTRAITNVREIASAPTLDATAGPAAVTVHQLTKRFGQRTAFSDVSFDVAYGEVFGFLGPNGAGKTTTVRTLGTLIAPTSGSATVAGIPLSPENEVEIRQRIAIMPEASGLYLRLTVTENLEYFAGLYGLHNPGSRIEKALDAVNLANRSGDLCGGLSKGLRQRVSLARTLLSDPAVMFLDEPTSGLDPVAAREVHDLIVGLRRARSDHLPHHPPARRGREALRPGGHHEQHAAHRWHAGGVEGPALQEVARRHHRQSGRAPRAALHQHQGCRGLARRRRRFLCALGVRAEGGCTRGGAESRPCGSRCPHRR